MTTPDKCPYCGAEKDEIMRNQWVCGSYKFPHDAPIDRHYQCYERQIKRLTAALNNVLKSAHPNQRDNPSMYAAWESAREALNPGGAS